MHIMETERRQSPRYQINQLVELEFARETFVNAESKDISTNGIGFITAVPIELYTRMFFMVKLDPDQTDPEIRGEGIVTRCEPTENGEYEIGMEFTEVPESMLQLLDDYLET